MEPAIKMLRTQRVPIFLLVDSIRHSEEELSISLRVLRDIELLGRFYVFDNPIAVNSFLLKHDFLFNAIFEAYKHLNEIFGAGVETHLKIHNDPEEDFEALFIIVKSVLPSDQSLNLLDRFDEEWWLDVDDEIRKLIEVDVENMP